MASKPDPHKIDDDTPSNALKSPPTQASGSFSNKPAASATAKHGGFKPHPSDGEPDPALDDKPKAASQLGATPANTRAPTSSAPGNPPTGAGQPSPENAAQMTGQAHNPNAPPSAETYGKVLDPNAPPRNDDPDHVPTQHELDEHKPKLNKVEAEQLLRAGHRLRVRGDHPENWIAMTRHSGQMALSHNATPDAIEKIVSQDVILAEG